MTPGCPVAFFARLDPEREALRFEDRLWTYAALDAEVSKWAASLRASGIDAGDRVGVLSTNGAEVVFLVHALARLGAAIVPFNARLTASELAAQVSVARPAVVFAERALAERIDGAVALELGRRFERRLPYEAPRPHRPRTRAILFTSGTSGRAKAAALSFESFVAAAAASALNVGGEPSDRWLGNLPLFHVGGLTMAVRCALYGASLWLQARFDAGAVNDAIDAGATHVSLVATTLQRTLEARGDRPFPSTLKAALIGGGPVPAPVMERAQRLGAKVLQTYGLTESCAQVATERPGDADGSTAGPPLPGLRVRVVDERGFDVPLGGVGEIEVQGATVMLGYFGDEEATHQTLWKGWLRTRDLGSLDARGRLTVHARRTDLIVSGGENVYPAEIEAVLAAHPSVVEAAVAAIPDAHWGQLPAAVVALREETTDAALAEFCAARLARFKIPRRFVRVVALPRNAGGKVDRTALRALVDGKAAP